MKNIFLIEVILIILIFNSYLLGQETSDKTMNPSLKVKSGLYDSIMTIHYSIPEKMFMELLIVNRMGFIVEEPFAQDVQAGEDSIKVYIGNYLTGSYNVWCKVNHTPIVPMHKFKHAKNGQQVTFSQEERDLHNKMPMCDATTCTPGDITAFKDFLNKYPNYLDRGHVFEIALLTYIKLDQDSSLIKSTIDSLVMYLPHFYTYYMIARHLSEYNKLPYLSRQYIVKARSTIETIPRDVQKERLSDLDEYEKKINH